MPAFVSSFSNGKPISRLAGTRWLVPGYGLAVLFTENEGRVLHLAGNTHWTETDADAYSADYFRLVAFGQGSVRFAGAADGTHYRATPLRRLPALSEASPRAVFDAFGATMEAHYAFFRERRIDWTARRRLREKIDPDAADGALFETLLAALDGIEDAHLRLSAKIGGVERVAAAGRGKIGLLLRDAFSHQSALPDLDSFGRDWTKRDRAGAFDLLLPESRGKALEGRLSWGRLNDATGYLELTSMAGFAATTEGDLAALAPALDSALAGMRATTRLVLDLAQNRGGDDRVARLLASRFADRRRPVYTKVPYRRPASERQQFFLVPSRATYPGRVHLLTSSVTVSAAEVAVHCLKALPQVTHWGEPTRGALSDRLTLSLPNGWLLSLSNEIYRNHSGFCAEGIGIAPERPVPVFSADDLFHGHARAVRRLASDPGVA